MSFGRRSSAPLRNASERELTMTTNRVVRADQYQRRREQLAAGAVRIASYKLADRIVCEVDNVDPAAQLARPGRRGDPGRSGGPGAGEGGQVAEENPRSRSGIRCRWGHGEAVSRIWDA
jgi:hypothetical protein